jgi:EAL domain-containing protein (putative c-di-GMP-specific phosphodiesterase class I)
LYAPKQRASLSQSQAQGGKLGARALNGAEHRGDAGFVAFQNAGFDNDPHEPSVGGQSHRHSCTDPIGTVSPTFARSNDPLGQWVLETACEQLRSWQVHGIAPARMAVNVSSHQLMRPGFVQLVEGTIATAGISPRCLELEVTESVFMDVEGVAAAALGRLHALGVVIALDDFGTGYSYLRRLPIDVLKIDRSFTMAVPEDEDSNGIVTAIPSMAHHLRKEVTAEGVETQAQLDFLRSHGCDMAQGYHLSRPLAAFAQFIASRQIAAA